MLGNHQGPRFRPKAGGRRGGGIGTRVPTGSEGDQTAADLDQTTSDLDQTASDADQTASDADQAASDSDRRASDRDQAASDRELATNVPATGALEVTHDASRTDRQQSNFERDETTLARARIAVERAETAERRDETAHLRDLAAGARNHAAAERYRAEELGQLLDPQPGSAAHVRSVGAARIRAASDREQAAHDRDQAARDREAAAHDREQSRRDLDRAHLDDLTGVYRRSIGSVALQHEIARARRSDKQLVLAFVDVDGLKEVNDRQGHAVGDTLLQAVTAAIRSKLRSYDPIVRFGGDEFVCALSDADLGQAERRFDEIRRELGETHTSDSISVGLAALRPGDSLEELMARGDQALYEVRPTADRG